MRTPRMVAATRKDNVMTHEIDRKRDDLIDLGSVVDETKGIGLVSDDQQGGQLPGIGLTDD